MATFAQFFPKTLFVHYAPEFFFSPQCKNSHITKSMIIFWVKSIMNSSKALKQGQLGNLTFH
jgi:hypothetical protein